MISMYHACVLINSRSQFSLYVSCRNHVADDKQKDFNCVTTDLAAWILEINLPERVLEVFETRFGPRISIAGFDPHYGFNCKAVKGFCSI